MTAFVDALCATIDALHVEGLPTLVAIDGPECAALEAALARLAGGRAARYQPYDWDRDLLGLSIDIEPRPIVLVENL